MGSYLPHVFLSLQSLLVQLTLSRESCYYSSDQCVLKCVSSGRGRSSGDDGGGDYHRPGDPPPYSSNRMSHMSTLILS